MYKISYETHEIPDELPANAVVEELILLPLEMVTSLSRVVEVEGGGDGDTFLTIRDTGFGANRGGTCALLSNDEARKVAHALLEAVDEKVD